MQPADDVDARIDYERYYLDRLTKSRKSGDSIIGCCPIHADRNPSFQANIATGCWRCYGCGEKGNIYTFVEKVDKLSKDAARDTVHRLAGIERRVAPATGATLAELARAEARIAAGQTPDTPPAPTPAKTTPSPSGETVTAMGKLTVEDYAADKHLDIDMLKSLKVSSNRQTRAVDIPYMTADGEVPCVRRRWPKGHDSRMTWRPGSAGKIIPYGVWQERVIDGRVFIFEGESDSHTLWQRGVENVIGCPGALMWRDDWNRYVASAREVFVHREPPTVKDDGRVIDAGGDMVKRIARSLYASGFTGQVFEFSIHDATGGRAKDPSDLHIDDASGVDGAPSWDDAWPAAVANAKLVDADAVKADDRNSITGGLEIPDRFTVDDTTGTIQKVGLDKQGNVTRHVVSAVPVFPSARLRSVDTGEEKLALRFRRDGRWHEVSAKRSTIYSTQKVVELADRGLTVSSINSRLLVEYLGAVEAANLERLDLKRSVERLGWVGTGAFAPTHLGDVTLDIPDGLDNLAGGYVQKGDADVWLDTARTIREKHPVARAILAAAFAAPLLRVIGQRSFGLYVWSRSRGGKTAAEKFALGVWGDPETLMVTFNATQVGIERLAAFYNDLPLGIDERQIVGDDRGGSLNQLAYMIGAGKGRIRGARDGGLQQVSTWRTVAIMTGEQELTDTSTQEGVSTRVLQVAGAPIDDEHDAQQLHRTVDAHHGHAGMVYMTALLNARADGGDEAIVADHRAIAAELEAACGPNALAHVSSVAALALADWYASRWVFGVDDRDGAVALGLDVLARLDGTDEMSMSARMVEWCHDWIDRNRSRFTESIGYGERYGKIERDGSVYVIPSVLDDAIREMGWRSRQVRDALASEGAIRLGANGSRTVSTRYDGRVCKMVAFESWGDFVPGGSVGQSGYTGYEVVTPRGDEIDVTPCDSLNRY